MSLRRATGVAVAVLVASDALLTGLASWRSWQMLGHLHAMVADSRARAIAAAAARGRHVSLPPAHPVSLTEALSWPVMDGVLVLAVGLLAVLVVRSGRRWVWLPMAGLFLPFAEPMLWLSADQTPASLWAGRVGQLAVVSAACAALLWLGPRAASRSPMPFGEVARRLAVPGVLALLVVLVVIAGPNHHDAGLVTGFGAMLVGGLMYADRWSCRSRWRAALSSTHSWSIPTM